MKPFYLIVLLSLLGAYPVSRAQSYDYVMTGALSYSSVTGSSFANGDTFRLTFTLDNSILNSINSSVGEYFPSAVTNLNFALGPGSTGTYAGGNVAGGLAVSMDASGGSNDQVTVIAQPAGFPHGGLNFADAGSHPFYIMGLSLYSNKGASFNFGAGNPLTNSLGSVLPTLNLSAFSQVATVTLSFDGGSSNAFFDIHSISIAPIPEPSTEAALAGMGMLGFAACRRRRGR